MGARGVEERVGVPGGEALVEEVVVEGGGSGKEGFSKELGFGRLRAGGAVRVQGETNNERADLVTADEPADGVEIGLLGGAVKGEEGLRGEVEGVRDREADAAVPYIQRKCAVRGHARECSGRRGVEPWTGETA